MRITDERYHRDRLRYDLALRMIGHEARTCTIRGWTGLSDDRIRRLYRTYVEFDRASPVRRHRGKSPRQASYFLRSGSTQVEGTLLANILGASGLLGSLRTLPGQINLDFGTRFCEAYEAYLEHAHAPAVSFEHAWLLLKALACAEEICLSACPRCTGSFIRDVFALGIRLCPLCRIKRPRPARAVARDVTQSAVPAAFAGSIDPGGARIDC
jgi:hypothetical protein